MVNHIEHVQQSGSEKRQNRPRQQRLALFRDTPPDEAEASHTAETPAAAEEEQEKPSALLAGEQSAEAAPEGTTSDISTGESEPSPSDPAVPDEAQTASLRSPETPPASSAPIDEHDPIGVKLHKARHALHLTEKEVSKVTCVPRSVITNLENERFSELPPFLYTRAYLEKLCRYYELPFEKLLNQLSEKNPDLQKTSYGNRFYLTQAEDGSSHKLQYNFQAQPHPENRHTLALTPSTLAGLVAGAILIILLATVFAVQQAQKPAPPENESAPAEKPEDSSEKSEPVDLEQLIIPHPLPMKELEVPKD